MTGWFLSGGADPDAPAVVCFPHAGGDPRTYLDWRPDLAPVGVQAVCVPGRGHRFVEPRVGSLAELADAAAEAIRTLPHRRICLFGHSLGGLVAFEVARRLHDHEPVHHLVVSGCAAPSSLPTEYIVWAAGLPWAEFVEATARYEDLPQEVAEDPELAELLLPELQADVRLFAGYSYRPAAPLAIGLSLVNGAADPRVADGRLHAWEREAVAPPEYHWRDGGHFYLAGRPRTVTGVIREALDRDPVPAEHVEVI
jgi:surfactin synthase thioesterase subunit